MYQKYMQDVEEIKIFITSNIFYLYKQYKPTRIEKIKNTMFLSAVSLFPVKETNKNETNRELVYHNMHNLRTRSKRYFSVQFPHIIHIVS